MTKKYEVKAIIFDVGGVLAISKIPMIVRKKNYRSLGVHQDIAKKLKISLDQWFDSIDSAYADAIEGKISEQKFLSIISKNIKTTPKKLEKFFIRAYKKNFKINKELYKTAFKLKKKGYKIAILSDQHQISQKVLMPIKYIKKFDVVITSHYSGMRKPDSRIYKLTLRKLKLKPEQTIFIDNQEWNIKPAKKLGMKTILYKNNKQTFEELSKILKDYPKP